MHFCMCAQTQGPGYVYRSQSVCRREGGRDVTLLTHAVVLQITLGPCLWHSEFGQMVLINLTMKSFVFEADSQLPSQDIFIFVYFIYSQAI